MFFCICSIASVSWTDSWGEPMGQCRGEWSCQWGEEQVPGGGVAVPDQPTGQGHQWHCISSYWVSQNTAAYFWHSFIERAFCYDRFLLTFLDIIKFTVREYKCNAFNEQLTAALDYNYFHLPPCWCHKLCSTSRELSAHALIAVFHPLQ